MLIADEELEVTSVEAVSGEYLVAGVDRGRVLLLNLETGLIERVWKGFRAPHAEVFAKEGQRYCGLLQCKRGVLEVFALPCSDKLAAFKVDPSARMASRPGGGLVVVDSRLSLSELEFPP